MLTVILVVHLLLAIAMIGVILLQRSEGGALGIGGGGGGGGFMTGRSTANMLTRATAVLAGAFMVTSMALSIMANADRESSSILDRAEPATAVEQPVEEKGPTAPIAK